MSWRNRRRGSSTPSAKATSPGLLSVAAEEGALSDPATSATDRVVVLGHGVVT